MFERIPRRTKVLSMAPTFVANRRRVLKIQFPRICFASVRDRLTRKLGAGVRIELMKFRKPNDEGNEPSPLIMIAIAVVPLLAVAGWFLFR